jgi:hypothetical protein
MKVSLYHGKNVTTGTVANFKVMEHKDAVIQINHACVD